RIGGSRAAICRTVGAPPVLCRSTAAAARGQRAKIRAGHGMPEAEAAEAARSTPFAGSADDVVRALEAYRDACAEAVVFDWPAPFDDSTLDALAGPVTERLG